MSWIKSDCSMSRHPKTNKLMSALGCSRIEAVGLLHIFWHWVLDYCELGDISQYKDSLNISLGYPESYPKDILQALKDCGWVDNDNRVHDWLEYAYEFLYRKYHTSNPKKAELLTKEYRLTLGKPKGRPKVSPDKIREDKIREDKNREDKNREDKKEDIVPNSEADSTPEPEVKPILVFPCKGGKAKEWGLSQNKVDEYHDSFPAIDILQECRNARQWCIDNPSKQKTYSGMPAFLSRWLARAQNKPNLGGQNNGRHEKKRNAIDYEPSKYDGIEIK